MEKFEINWVLVNEIAISPAPLRNENFKLIKKNKISSILCLCNENEYSTKYYEEQTKLILVKRPLPDHRQSNLPEFHQFEEILIDIENLIKNGPLLIHCLYGIERSPLICLLWLVKSRKLNFQEAFDYLMSVHKKTNPLSSQIKHAKKFLKYKKIAY